MNYRNIFLAFVFCLFSLGCSSIANAEDGGYFDAHYDFSKLQNIEVHINYNDPETSYISLLLPFYDQVLEKLSKKDFHAYPNGKRPSQVLRPDAHLIIDIEAADIHRGYTPGYVDWQPRVYYVPVINDKGEQVGYSSYVDYESYYVPGRHWLSHYFLIQYTLQDEQSGETIARYTYARNSSLAFADLARKTAGDFASRLAKERKKALKQKH